MHVCVEIMCADHQRRLHVLHLFTFVYMIWFEKTNISNAHVNGAVADFSLQSYILSMKKEWHTLRCFDQMGMYHQNFSYDSVITPIESMYMYIFFYLQ